MLPTLATDNHDFLFTVFFRMVADNVDVTVTGILVAYEVGMVLAWSELDVMLDEIAFVDEILFHDLLKYIFFVCQRDLPLIDSCLSLFHISPRQIQDAISLKSRGRDLKRASGEHFVRL